MLYVASSPARVADGHLSRALRASRIVFLSLVRYYRGDLHGEDLSRHRRKAMHLALIIDAAGFDEMDRRRSPQCHPIIED